MMTFRIGDIVRVRGDIGRVVAVERGGEIVVVRFPNSTVSPFPVERVERAGRLRTADR